MGFDSIPLTADEIARCLKARRSLPIGVLEQLTVTCLPAPVMLLPEKRPSILLGRLGGNVNTYPVVAAIDDDAAMTVTAVQRSSLSELRIELVQCQRQEAED